MNDDYNGRARRQSSTHLVLALILALSLGLNVWGNKWGVPHSWHPDELTHHASQMVYHRILNPGVFYYGGLHYYVLGASAVIPSMVYGRLLDPKPKESDSSAMAGWQIRRKALMVMLARTVSAVMATFTVFITYLMGKMLFGRGAGILAALFLAVSPYFVGVAHFATVDTPANLMYWLASLFALVYWKRGKSVWFVLACVTAGLAIGTKLDRAVIVIVLLLSYLLQGKEVRFRQMAKFAPLVLVGYVFANPTVILSFIEFLDGTTRDLFYNVLREGSEPASYKKILGDIKSGMGLPLFLISLAGFGYGIWSLSTGRHRAEFIFLTATIVPYYFVFGLRLAAVWYIPFFFPALSVFAAVLCIRVQDIAGTLAMRTLVVAVALFSLMSSVFLILQFTYDSRYLASEWINRQIPNNAVLEIGPRGPAVSNEKYRLIERSIHQAFGGFAFAREARDKMEVNRVYRSIRKCILDLEQLMSLKLGMAVRQEPYKAWFDRALDQSESSSGEPSRKEKPGESSPDYKILVDYLERGTISALKSKESKYQLVTTIQYMNPLGLEITFPFVNPKIYVFRRNYAPPPAG